MIEGTEGKKAPFGLPHKPATLVSVAKTAGRQVKVLASLTETELSKLMKAQGVSEEDSVLVKKEVADMKKSEASRNTGDWLHQRVSCCGVCRCDFEVSLQTGRL